MKTKDYKKFRVVFLVIVILLLIILRAGIINTIRTPFSGTTYLPLPSNYYITKMLIADKKTSDSSGNEIFKKDTIFPGSFIISINNKLFDTLYTNLDSSNAIVRYNKSIDKSNQTITLQVVNSSRPKFADELINGNYYFKYSEKYELSKNQLSDSSIKFIYDGIFLGYIDKNGATSRAGIKTGDILLNVNDIIWKVKFYPNVNSFQLDGKSLKLLRSQSIGEPLYYKVLRMNHEKIFEVYLATFGIQFEFLISVIIGLIFVFLGIYLILIKKGDYGSLLTGFFVFIIGFYLASMSYIKPLELDLILKLKLLTVEMSPIIAFAIFLHSLNYFPSENQTLTNKKWFIPILYLIFTSEIIIRSWILMFDITWIKYSPLIFISFLGFFYYGIIRFIYRKSENSRHKNIIWVLYFTFLFVLILTQLRMLLFWLFKIQYIPILDYAFLITIIFPIEYIIFFNKQKLYGFKFRIKRTIQYNLVTLTWKLFTFAFCLYSIWYLSKISLQLPGIMIYGGIIEILTLPVNIQPNLSIEKLLFGFTTIFIVYFTYIITKIGLNYLDKKFYRQKFDYRLAQKGLINLLETKLTISDLAKVIVEKLTELVHLKRVGTIFIKNGSQNKDEKVYCFDSLIGNDFCYCIDNEIFDTIKKYSEPIKVNKLPENIRKVFIENNFQYIIPIQRNEILLGALFIGEKLSETELKKDDLEFLVSVASSASVTIENAVLYEELTEQERIKHELEIARKIQIASLPQKVPQIRGLDIAGTSVPAFEVGGDFFDFYERPDENLTVVLGDVSGKGTSAALYMSKIQGILRTLNEFELSPKELFIRTNRLLFGSIDNKAFVTAIAASFDTKNHNLIVARAGHIPLYKFDGDTCKIEAIQSKGIGLALAFESSFNPLIEEINIKFKKNDMFLFISDGLTDSRNKLHEEFGISRLLTIFAESSNLNSQNICDNILKSINEFSKDVTQFDDMTLVIVKSVN
jgi:serine phosphatase RsbU (regulator of sigma subunit)